VNLSVSAVLGVVFVTLKLTGVIAWSWLWVLAPFWMGPAIVFGISGIAAIGVLLASIGTGRRP
jgi:hypothetical protein